MPTESQVFNSFLSMSETVLQEVWLPGLYDVSFRRQNASLTNKIRRSSEGIEGLEVNLPFLTQYGWSFRPMSEYGYTPTPSPVKTAKQTVKLSGHACTIGVTKEAILATQGDQSKIGNLMNVHMTGVSKQLPYYIRQMIWTGESGVLGVVGSVSGSVITLSGTGMPNSATEDRARYIEAGMYIQALTSAGVKRGDPMLVSSVDKNLGTVTVETAVSGLTGTDLLAITDIAGLENGYGNANNSPGVLDVINDDNTFQGINRALAANANMRALIRGNGGTPRDPTTTLLETFFQDINNPTFAICDYRLLRYIVTKNFSENVRWQAARTYEDGIESVTIANTKITSDDDAHIDKLIVPDLTNMRIADKGGISSLTEGWKQVQGRPFFENTFVYYGRLIAEDCRYMGSLNDLKQAA